MKAIIPPKLFFISIIVMIILRWFAPIRQYIDYPFNLAGLILFVTGLGVAKYSSDIFEKQGTNIQTFEEPDILVAEGIFKMSRNPMYLGFLIALAGLSLFFGTLSSIFIVILFFLITDRWYIKFEEDMMIEKFGEQYLTYKEQTRKWL